MDFFSRLYTNITKNGFTAGHTNSPVHPLASFTREEGSTWHVVLVVNMDNITFSDFISASNRYTQFYKNLHESKRPTNIFITNVLVSQDSTTEIENFIQSLPPFSQESVNNVFWNLSLSDGKFSFHKDYPTQILNLRTIIESTYKNTASPISLFKITESSSSTLTYLVIALNVIVFAIVYFTGGTNIHNLIRFGALVPDLVRAGEIYRLFSAMFLHASMTHLALNMVSLYVFGTRVERFYSSAYFAVIYTVAGLTGSLGSMFLTGTTSVGASGAIFGLVGAALVMAKFAKRDLHGLTYQTMLFFIILNAGIGFALPNTDNFGHLGGLFGGILAGYIICKMKTKAGKNETNR